MPLLENPASSCTCYCESLRSVNIGERKGNEKRKQRWASIEKAERERERVCRSNGKKKLAYAYKQWKSEQRSAIEIYTMRKIEVQSFGRRFLRGNEMLRISFSFDLFFSQLKFSLNS